MEEASCTKEGLKERSCECGNKESEKIALAEHSYTSEVTAPTCTETGYTTYTCTCGDSYTADATEAVGHSYTSEVTAPTCTVGGYTTYTCTCGDTYTADTTVAKGHSYTSEVTEPTCTDGGYTTYTCTVCGYDCKDNEVVASGHVAGDSKIVTEPNCYDGGYTTYLCEVCGESYVDDETEPVHALGEWIISEVGVTTDTYVKSCKCGQNTQTMTGMPKASTDLAMELNEDGTGYIVTGLGNCTDTDIVIPTTYNGKPVVEIGSMAFYEVGISSVTIIGGVEIINGYAFSGYTIEKIAILGGVKTIGSAAFFYCGSCSTVIISDSVNKIEESAFFGLNSNHPGEDVNIYYTGTEEQWKQIQIDANKEITGNTITYNYVCGE